MKKEYTFKVYGNQLRFDYCPICKREGKNPDFSFNKEIKQFYCHREGRYGDLLDLKKHDRDFYNFLKLVLSGNEKVKVERSNKIKDEAVNLNEVFLSRGNCLLNQEWRDYLKSRGIGEEHLDRLFRLGKNNNMMIPITDGKNIIAIKYRDMAKKYLYSERGSKGDYFINWQHINKRDYIIIVEGEIDLLSALESGFENVVSLPMGASDINAVKNQKNWLLEFKKIIIAVDKDEAGKKAYRKILKELNWKNEEIYCVDMGEYKDFNEVLMGEGIGKIREIVANCQKVERFKIVEEVEEDRFFQGENGYYIKERGEEKQITDFILDIKEISNKFIKGTTYNMGRAKEFRASKSELLFLNGIVEYLGYYFGPKNSIPSFWSWILKQNRDKFVIDIDHYGIIDEIYYDSSSKAICEKNELYIQSLDSIPEVTRGDKKILKELLPYLRKDSNQSLLGICWALGRLHNLTSYPILELEGSTSVGKTIFGEFICRILLGSRDNIKSLSTVTIHQIRILSSCSNITPWVLDEIKLTTKSIKDKTDELLSTIRSVYDNKTVNQGNLTTKLLEYKLCTPLIISGETKINDVSIRNRILSVELNQENKGDDKIFEKFKNTQLLEKLGKQAILNRLADGKIVVKKQKLQEIFPDIRDDRQLHNIKCVYTGLLALKKIVNLNSKIVDKFLLFLNEFGKNERTTVKNFLLLLELVAESDKDPRSFYQVKDGRHYLWFNILYKAIADEHTKTNSSLELLDMSTLKKQLKEANFILDDRVYIRFPINEYSKKTKTVNAVEIIPIDIFSNCSEDDE